jgi:hypothetical protein
MTSPMPSLPPDLRERVLAAAAREPAAPRAVGARRRARAVALGFGALLATFAIIGPRAHGRPLGYIAAVFLAWLPIAAAATWAGVSQGRSMLGRPARWLVAVVVLTPVALTASWAAVVLSWPSMLHDLSGPRQYVVCDVVTLLFSVGPLLAFGALRRGTAPVAPRLTGAALGTAAAAWAALVLHLVCGYTAPVHILMGHVLPIVLVTLVGAMVMARKVALGG